MTGTAHLAFPASVQAHRLANPPLKCWLDTVQGLVVVKASAFHSELDLRRGRPVH
jgi:hypothetical protein